MLGDRPPSSRSRSSGGAVAPPLALTPTLCCCCCSSSCGPEQQLELVAFRDGRAPRPRRGCTPERPLLAPWLRRAEVDGRIVLEYGDEIVVLGGAQARAVLDGLLSLLDGSRTVAEIARELRSPLASSREWSPTCAHTGSS